jgi:hypothetical protein
MFSGVVRQRAQVEDLAASGSPRPSRSCHPVGKVPSGALTCTSQVPLLQRPGLRIELFAFCISTGQQGLRSGQRPEGTTWCRLGSTSCHPNSFHLEDQVQVATLSGERTSSPQSALSLATLDSCQQSGGNFKLLNFLDPHRHGVLLQGRP